jgi:hypothetical protein
MRLHSLTEGCWGLGRGVRDLWEGGREGACVTQLMMMKYRAVRPLVSSLRVCV